MTDTLITALDAIASQHLPTHTRHLLAELKGGLPAVHLANGDWQPIANDMAGTWSYWRHIGNPQESANPIPGSQSAIRWSFSLRLVSLCEIEGTDAQKAIAAALSAAQDIRSNARTIARALDAYRVEVARMEVRVDDEAIAAAELNAAAIPSNRRLVAMDIGVNVTGEAGCLDPCCPPAAITKGTPCEIIASAQVATILGCLTDEQEAAIIAELCDGPGGPCPTLCELIEAEEDPTDAVACIPSEGVPVWLALLILREEATAEVIVVAIDGANKADAVRAILCPTCEPLGYDLHDSLGTLILSGVVTDPCGATVELVAPDATAVLKDTLGNVLAVLAIRSNTSSDITAPNGTVTRDGEPFGTVLAGGAINVPSDPGAFPAGLWYLQDSMANLLASGSIGVGGPPAYITAPDAEIRTTSGATVVLVVTSAGSDNIPKSYIKAEDQDGAEKLLGPWNTEEADTDFLAPDVVIPRRPILNSEAAEIGSAKVTAGDLLDDTLPIVPDITITDQNGTDSAHPAGVSVDIRDYRSGILYRPPVWSGEANTFGTGSEGWQFANGLMAYTPPLFPLYRAQLDHTAARPFHTLTENNKWGHKNRFCGTTGGYHDGTTYRDIAGAATTQALAFPNSELVDHLTGKMWKFTPEASATWANALSNAEASTHNGRTDWHLGPESALYGLMDGSLGTNPLNYAPLFITGTALWSSTTHNSVTTNARNLQTAGIIAATGKTTSMAFLLYRNHMS